ncbi:MAG TPA: hypothetical protein VHX37_11350 [Acidobacteriaceae bacterium]|jgi:hypothetical protein|nr:hypothetical protein [Acidobacteriaceae bacterium]
MRQFFTVSIMFLACLAGSAQQTSRTFTDKDGDKTTMNVQTGWVMTDSSGQSGSFTPAEVNDMCQEGEKWGLLATPDNRAMSYLCDEWWKLQPATAIEKVPFRTLIQKLFVNTGPSPSFVRFRGMNLKSDTQSAVYDAAIVPNDVGQEATCLVDEDRPDTGGKLYVYKCEMKTNCFTSALILRNQLVQVARTLNLKEDEIREHGVAVKAKESGQCAPTGQCMDQYAYVSVDGGKALVITANPVFTRDTMAELLAREHGADSAITGIANDEGNVTFEIFSAMQSDSK